MRRYFIIIGHFRDALRLSFKTGCNALSRVYYFSFTFSYQWFLHEASQRIGCVKRYVDDSVRPWKFFLSHYLKNVGSEFLLKCNFKLSSLPCKLPINYKKCLEAWSDFKSCTPVKRQDILNEIIWNNQNLLINKQSIFKKKM